MMDDDPCKSVDVVSDPREAEQSTPSIDTHGFLNDCILKAWFHLRNCFPDRYEFSTDEICDYIDKNWEAVTGLSLRIDCWKATVQGALGESDFLVQSTQVGAPPDSWVVMDATVTSPLRATPQPELIELGLIRKREFSTIIAEEPEDCSKMARGRRMQRKLATIEKDPATSSTSIVDKSSPQESGRDKTTISRTAEHFTRGAIPVDFTAVPEGPVRLSSVDRGNGLIFLDGDESCKVVRGHKGYRMVRSTHGVCMGDWFFEATIMPYEGDGAVRLGWSTRRTDAETPVGCDGQSFGIRDRTGEFIHKSHLRSYGKPFGIGDVIGCRMFLPCIEEDVVELIQASDHRWLEYRFSKFLQGKPPPDTGLVHEYAFVEFFKNGESFGVPQRLGLDSEFDNDNCSSQSTHQGNYRGIPLGMYYPSIAVYRNAIVSVNFGPDFTFQLPDGSQPFSKNVDTQKPKVVSTNDENEVGQVKAEPSPIESIFVQGQDNDTFGDEQVDLLIAPEMKMECVSFNSHPKFEDQEVQLDREQHISFPSLTMEIAKEQEAKTIRGTRLS